jgi:predicted ester cyclase
MGQLKALVDQVWTILETGRFDALGEVYTPESEFAMPGGLRLRGPEQIGQVMRAYFAAFPGLRHEVVDFVEAGETIALELRITGTHTGTMQTPNGPIPPTGRQVTWESVDFVKVAGGKIVSWHAYFDQMAFLMQLGLIPEPAAA